MQKVMDAYGNYYFITTQTRIQEGASWEDIEDGNAYETAYLVFDDEGNNIWDTTCYTFVKPYFERYQLIDSDWEATETERTTKQ